MYEDNCFITLTYEDEKLPKWGSLKKRDFQLFMKKLRKKFPHKKIRYYHCGEYGETTGRPHYHACLFGFDFPDKYFFKMRRDCHVYKSDTLDEIWGMGITELGNVTFDSAAYVARYIMKKVTGPRAEEHYAVIDKDTGEYGERQPEYTTMSRRPGIGKSWWEKYKNEVFPADEVIMNGKPIKPPRYYDNLFELEDSSGKGLVQAKRDANRMRMDETPDRLAVREVCTKRRVNRYTRETLL